jgi:hypothetical protein
MTYETPAVETYGTVAQHTLGEYIPEEPKFSVPIMEAN